MYRSFTEMPVWKKAHELSTIVFKMTIGLPKSEDYGLISQIRRSSNSISANIAEAYGRLGEKDKSNFYVFARGSAFETQNHLLYGKEIGYFENDSVSKLCEEYENLNIEINRILKSLT